jgi:hypothetical protein
MYMPWMDPRQGPVKISAHEAARQRAVSQALKTPKVPPRSQSPVCGSSDDDDPAGSEWIWSQTKGCMRNNKHFRKSAPTTDTVEANTPPAKSFNPFVPRSSTPTGSAPAPLAKAPPRPVTPTVSVPAHPPSPKGVKSKGAGKKAATKPAVSETTQPKSKQSVSRAGGLRPGVGGSGKTDTHEASSHPSKT